MKRLAITVLAVVALATTFTACKKEKDAAVDLMQDQAFITAASSSNMFETAAANMALGKTKNAEVTAYANNVITDNGKTATEMLILAQQKQLDLAQSMSTRYQDQLIMLNALADTAFNRQYVAMMVTSHQATVNLYTSASQNSVKDAGIKDFAAKKLPEIKKHLDDANALKTQVGQ